MKYKIVFEETVTYKPINVDASDESEAFEQAKEALDFGYIDVLETDTVVTETAKVISEFGTRTKRTVKKQEEK